MGTTSNIAIVEGNQLTQLVNLIRYFMCQEIEGPLHTTLASNRYTRITFGVPKINFTLCGVIMAAINTMKYNINTGWF